MAIFELDMTQFEESSPIPIVIRVRLALSKMGMRFEDDGKTSLAINENQTPLGEVVMWEDYGTPGIRFYRQELPKKE